MRLTEYFWRGPIAAALIGAVVACAGGPSMPVNMAVDSSRERDAEPVSGLGAQVLAPGECGLFLWSQANLSKLVFFRRAQTSAAALSLSDRRYDLQLVSEGGEVFGQFLTRNEFSDGQGGIVELAFQPGAMLIDGQRTSGGLITHTDAAGWRTIVPVAGVRACLDE